MGYWEQTCENNRKHEAKRAAMHPLRRKLGDALGMAFIIAANALIWAAMLSPLWFSWVK